VVLLTFSSLLIRLGCQSGQHRLRERRRDRNAVEVIADDLGTTRWRTADDSDEPSSVRHAIRHVHRAVAEAALVDELEVQTQIGR